MINFMQTEKCAINQNYEFYYASKVGLRSICYRICNCAIRTMHSLIHAYDSENRESEKAIAEQCNCKNKVNYKTRLIALLIRDE